MVHYQPLHGQKSGPERVSQALNHISIWKSTPGANIEFYFQCFSQKYILVIMWSIISPYMARKVVRRGFLSPWTKYQSKNRHQALLLDIIWNFIVKNIYWPSCGPLSALTWPEKWSGEVFSVRGQSIILKIDTRHYYWILFETL